MHLYEVRLDRGTNNESWTIFFRNISNLKAISPDFGGINNIVLLKHHMNKATIYALCMDGIKKRNQKDLHVEEITDESMKIHHSIYIDTIISYFFPYDDFEKISKEKWL